MNKFKFKISQAPSIGSSLSVNIQPRKWYIAWLYVKAFTKASCMWVKVFFKTLFEKQ